MALWQSTDANTSAPKFAPSLVKLSNTQDNVNLVFGNVTVSAFVANTVTGVFGVDTTEQSVSASSVTSGHPQHAGWVLRQAGTGPVVSITANTGAYSPDGNVYIRFTGGGTSNVSANAQVFTNSVSKAITTITVNSGGEYSLTPSAAATNANATFTITMGGRANRVMTETLVAMGSMTSDAADDAIFPDS